MKFYIKTTLNDEYTIDILSFEHCNDDLIIRDSTNSYRYFPAEGIIEFRMCA